MIRKKKVLSAWAIGSGGVIEGVCKMCFGNVIGFEFVSLVSRTYGDIIVELAPGVATVGDVVGKTISQHCLKFGKESVSLVQVREVYEKPLDSVFRRRK